MTDQRDDPEIAAWLARCEECWLDLLLRRAADVCQMGPALLEEPSVAV